VSLSSGRGDEMDKWEYLEIYVSGSEWVDNLGHTGQLQRMGIGITRSDHVYSLSPILNELGQSGWELVDSSVFESSKEDQCYKLILKRLIN
jgi:hypothetical protein